jgi:hypothetical protein
VTARDRRKYKIVENLIITLERKYGPKPALDHGHGSAFPGPNWSICFLCNFFELLDHGCLDLKSPVWITVIRTRKANFGPWSIVPEKSDLDHGHLGLKRQVWTMRPYIKQEKTKCFVHCDQSYILSSPIVAIV